MPTMNQARYFFQVALQAPWYGFTANINAESSLRNQFFALQDCDQGKYIPSTTSDLL